MLSRDEIVTEPQGSVTERGQGEGGSQWRGGSRSETPRNGEPPSPWQMSNSAPSTESCDQASTDTSHSDFCRSARSQAQQSPSASQKPDAEVLEKPVRRKFTAEYKRSILNEADACNEQGQLGALLRREGLYSSYLSKWRRERDAGIRQGLGGKKRGRKSTKNPLADENKRLARENVRLRSELGQVVVAADRADQVEMLGDGLHRQVAGAVLLAGLFEQPLAIPFVATLEGVLAPAVSAFAPVLAFAQNNDPEPVQDQRYREFLTDEPGKMPDRLPSCSQPWERKRLQIGEPGTHRVTGWC